MTEHEIEALQNRLIELEKNIRALRARAVGEVKKRPEVESVLIWSGIIFGIPAVLKKPWLLGLWVGYYLLKKRAES